MIRRIARVATSARIFAIALATTTTIGAPFAEETAPAAEPVPPTLALSEFMDLSSLTVDEDVHTVVTEALAGEEASGASVYVRARTIEYLTLQDAVMRALEKNLVLSVSKAASERVKEVLTEARAVFDPVFNLSASYARDNTNRRTIFGKVIQKSFQPKSPIDLPLNPKKTAAGIPQPDQLGFRKQSRDVVTKDIEVSQDQQGGPAESSSYDLAVAQQLPWGASLAIANVSTRKEVDYDKRGNSYDRPWTDSLALSLQIPLPYSKNFGPYSTQDVAVKLAAKVSERGYWELKSAINAVLAATDAAYWNAVFGLETLREVHQNRVLVEAQAAAASRLAKAGSITRYGKIQVDAELARVTAQEEAARRNFIIASTQLASLITDSADAVAKILFVPSDYAKFLNKSLDLQSADPFDLALKFRPELRAAQIDVEGGAINREFARVQTRPDLTFLGSIALGEKGDPVGYGDAAQALANIGDPDTANFSVGVNYRRPLANRAAKANYAAASTQYDDTKLSLNDLENVVKQGVADALAGVYSARQRAQIAQQQARLARDAYDRLLRRRETNGDVTELEIVLVSRRLLEARQSQVNALIDHKLAEARLLAAQGIIANQYAPTLANSEFERYRIGLLAANDALQFFQPVTKLR